LSCFIYAYSAYDFLEFVMDFSKKQASRVSVVCVFCKRLEKRLVTAGAARIDNDPDKTADEIYGNCVAVATQQVG